MDTKAAGILGGCLIVAALIVSLVPRGTNGATGGLRTIESAEGKLQVDYMVHTSPTTAEGSILQNVAKIDFTPHYVVVATKDGYGRIFFNERTQRLNWSFMQAAVSKKLPDEIK